jgi:soluble cytochrome b562
VLKGDDPRVERGVAVVDELARLVDSGRTLAPTMIEAVASAVEQAGRPDALLGDIVWRHRQRSITPTTAGQKAYVDAIRRNTITFGIGPAGTGKTYLAVALAAAALSRREVGRIILTRPAVEAGEKLGFLPGDIAAKVDPYLRPLFDAMHDMLDADRAAQSDGLDADLQTANDELQTAKANARQATKDAEDNPSNTKSFAEILEELFGSMDTAREIASQATGTFGGSAIQGLQAGDTYAQRTANASEETARNTEQLARQAKSGGGLVFQP